VLVKPQFEAGRERVGKGGVVRDPTVHQEVLVRVGEWLEQRGHAVLGICDSGHPGPKGNLEYFVYSCDGSAPPVSGGVDVATAAAHAVEAAHA
jgi:23S rRNA (cytidine1920-2'-O)/16S rRNA (cytidine1409-2'-O)-methyltransferase